MPLFVRWCHLNYINNQYYFTDAISLWMAFQKDLRLEMPDARITFNCKLKQNKWLYDFLFVNCCTSSSFDFRFVSWLIIGFHYLHLALILLAFFNTLSSKWLSEIGNWFDEKPNSFDGYQINIMFLFLMRVKRYGIFCEISIQNLLYNLLNKSWLFVFRLVSCELDEKKTYPNTQYIVW